MKTSNKLLTGALVLVMAMISITITAARFYQGEDEIKVKGIKITRDQLRKANVTAIKATGYLDIYLTQDSASDVRYEGDEKALASLNTELKDGTLLIENIVKHSRRRIKIYLSLPIIQKLDLNAGVYLNTENEIHGQNLELICMAGSSATMSMNYNSLKCNAVAGASMQLKGKAETTTMEAMAGSNIQAQDLHQQKCQFTGSAGSKGEVSVSGELSVNVNSGSVLNYFGTPAITGLNVSSGGTVNKR